MEPNQLSLEATPCEHAGDQDWSRDERLVCAHVPPLSDCPRSLAYTRCASCDHRLMRVRLYRIGPPGLEAIGGPGYRDTEAEVLSHAAEWSSCQAIAISYGASALLEGRASLYLHELVAPSAQIWRVDRLPGPQVPPFGACGDIWTPSSSEPLAVVPMHTQVASAPLRDDPTGAPIW